MIKQKKDFYIDILHIFILVSLALSKPLYVLSKYAEFFVARYSKPIDVVLLLFILSFLLPTLFVLLEVVAGFFSLHFRKAVHYFIVSGLFAVIAMTLLKQVDGLPGTVLITGATIIGILVTLTYIRFHSLRNFLTILFPLIFIFPYLFLFDSPVHKVVFPEKGPSVVKVKISNPPPIVMVIFDEFPVTSIMDENRRIDSHRYPNFAALARDATWFRNATTVSDHTHIAVPAILTGNYPEQNKLPTATEYPKNLFTLLGGFYDLNVYESLTQLCPERLCNRTVVRDVFPKRMKSLLADMTIVYLHVLLPADLTKDLPNVTRAWKHFTKDSVDLGNNQANNPKTFIEGIYSLIDTALTELKKDRGEVFRHFIRSIKATNKPILYFQHNYLPHTPWAYLPSGKKYSLVGDKINGLHREWWDDSELFVVEAYQRHLLQVGFVDTLLGELIERLKALDIYDSSLVIITTDHGVSFRPHDSRRYVTETNYQDIMPIPLFIKKPNQREGIISDQNVETIDILPTIADILDISLPWEVDGQSAFDQSYPERTEKVIFAKHTAEDRHVFDTELTAKYNAVERKLTLFGSGTNPARLFKFGPHSELVGEVLGQTNITRTSDTEVEIDHPKLYENVDLEAIFIPAHITGHLLKNVDKGNPLNLAIAVNGTIHAVTSTFFSGEAKFSAIVPETAFRKGKAEVEVFIVSESNGEIQLLRTKGVSPVSYYLATSGERVAIITSSKEKTYHIIHGTLRGSLDRIYKRDNFLELSGWAADVKNYDLPEALLVFVNGEFFHSGKTGFHRPDVSDYFKNPALLEAGFQIILPLTMLESISDMELRIFAISKDGLASELHYPKDYQGQKVVTF